MIKYKDVLNIGYYAYGEAFTGSYRNIRYRIAINPFKKYFKLSDDEKKDVKLRLFYWFSQNSFDKTNDSEILIKDFEYSQKGLEKIVDYINLQIKNI